MIDICFTWSLVQLIIVTSQEVLTTAAYLQKKYFLTGEAEDKTRKAGKKNPNQTKNKPKNPHTIKKGPNPPNQK